MTPQHISALAKGNHIRLWRAEVKRELKRLDRAESRKRCGAYVLENPPELGSMLLLDLIAACRGTGAILAERILRMLQIPPTRGVGALTERQRDVLAVALGDAAGVPARQRLKRDPARSWCPKCEESTALTDTGYCQWCDGRLALA